MQLRKLAGLAIMAVVLLTACGKKGPSYTQYIPKDASYVIAIDVKELMGKLEKDSLTIENMMEVLKDSSDPSKYSTAMSMWGQFKDAGLDFSQRVFISAPTLNVSESNMSIQVQVLAGLKDAKKLEEFIAKMPEAPAVKKDGDISYAAKDNMIIGWNSDAVMILSSNSRSNYHYGGDESSASPAVPGETAQLSQLKKYFALKESESIAEAPDFADLLGKKADIAVYTNSSSLAGGADLGLAMMPKVKELLKDIHSTSTINFEDGKVVMDGNTFVSKKLGDIINKYTGPVVDMDMIEPYPSNNVTGIAAFAFKTELIGELLKEAGFDALADMALAQKGLSTSDIIKAFKGDIAIMVSDFGVENVEHENGNGGKHLSLEPTVKMLAAVRIGDRPTFDKLIDLLIKEGMLVKNGNRLLLSQHGVPEVDEKMIVGVENGLLLISSDANVYNGYVAKSSKINLDADVTSHLKGASFAMYADAGKILSSIPDTVFGSHEIHAQNILARARPMFKTLYLTTENFDGKKIHGTGEMILADGKNSLPQLVRFLMFAAEEMKLQEAENKAKWMDAENITDPTEEDTE